MQPTIYEVKQLGSGVLSMMAKPVSGEYIEDEFNGIARLGVNLVVSLLERHEVYSLGLSAEEDLCAANGMDFMSFPIPDRGIPGSLSSFRKLTRGLYTRIHTGQSVVVHCRAGIGRAGIVAVGVLVESGMSPDAAFQLVSERRRVPVPDTDEQRQWIEANC